MSLHSGKGVQVLLTGMRLLAGKESGSPTPTYLLLHSSLDIDRTRQCQYNRLE